MSIEEAKEWIKAPNCPSYDNKHTIVYTEGRLHYGFCKTCNEKFYLVSETVLKELGMPIARPIQAN